MVIITTIHNYVVKRILVDQGSIADILYSTIAVGMNITRFDLKPHNSNLIGFLGKQVLAKGMVKLRVALGAWPVVANMDIDFLIVNAPNNVYNIILGRTTLNKVKAIISTPHLLMKFLIVNGINQFWANQVVARRCYMGSL